MALITTTLLDFLRLQVLLFGLRLAATRTCHFLATKAAHSKSQPRKIKQWIHRVILAWYAYCSGCWCGGSTKFSSPWDALLKFHVASSLVRGFWGGSKMLVDVKKSTFLFTPGLLLENIGVSILVAAIFLASVLPWTYSKFCLCRLQAGLGMQLQCPCQPLRVSEKRWLTPQIIWPFW